mmetsp:Transcript_90868/g.257293  ORF Transcript_90868/g.257293 Transcript_90868/m.257293 type:complete len:238 (+) Transcript_90868:138-851(+)
MRASSAAGVSASCCLRLSSALRASSRTFSSASCCSWSHVDMRISCVAFIAVTVFALSSAFVRLSHAMRSASKSLNASVFSTPCNSSQDPRRACNFAWAAAAFSAARAALGPAVRKVVSVLLAFWIRPSLAPRDRSVCIPRMRSARAVRKALKAARSATAMAAASTAVASHSASAYSTASRVTLETLEALPFRTLLGGSSFRGAPDSTKTPAVARRGSSLMGSPPLCGTVMAWMDRPS